MSPEPLGHMTHLTGGICACNDRCGVEVILPHPPETQLLLIRSCGFKGFHLPNLRRVGLVKQGRAVRSVIEQKPFLAEASAEMLRQERQNKMTRSDDRHQRAADFRKTDKAGEVMRFVFVARQDF